MVPQEMREYAPAQDFYQQALSIFIGFGDHYEQAGIYGQLGLLAEAQEDYAEARTNLQKALEIYVEYKDEYMANITKENLERLLGCFVCFHNRPEMNYGLRHASLSGLIAKVN